MIDSDSSDGETEATPKADLTLADRVKMRRRQVSLLAGGGIKFNDPATILPTLVKPGDIVKRHGIILYFDV